MNNKIIDLEIEKIGIKTNHLMHFLLTILTGIWGIVWIFATLRNNQKRNDIDDKIKILKIKGEL